MSVHAKLMKARLALQAKQLKKSGKNTYAGYEYFELGDFLPTVQEIFSELGLCGIVSYTKEIATLTIHDMDGGAIEITSPMGSAALKGCHEVQNVGAVETYQRRYLWVTAMEIVEHDAIDSVAGKEKPEKPKSPVRPNSVGEDAYSAASDEQRKFYDEKVEEIRTLLSFKEIQKASRLFYADNLNEEEMAAIWSRLNSDERASIKTFKPEKK